LMIKSWLKGSHRDQNGDEPISLARDLFFRPQPGQHPNSDALCRRWTIEQVAFLAPPGSPLTIFQAIFQEFVCLKNGDLPFDILFNVNHNNFQNSQRPPE